MLIGYARVSTQQQNLDRQVAALTAAGCARIFAEKASGKSTGNRAELAKAIAALTPGDVLLLAEWDRATRSMMDGIDIIRQVAACQATVKALDKPWLDLTTPIGCGFLAFLSALAEDERHRIVDRAASGRKAARARGARFGRKPKLDAHQREHAFKLMDENLSDRAIGRALGVHHGTIARLRKTGALG
ncbi:MAG: recombinase family protein [Hyphomicrobiaceae bacterium]|nr:recombinase family protein [Hyphomicrobiaceae bacterium]